MVAKVRLHSSRLEMPFLNHCRPHPIGGMFMNACPRYGIQLPERNVILVRDAGDISLRLNSQKSLCGAVYNIRSLRDGFWIISWHLPLFSPDELSAV